MYLCAECCEIFEEKTEAETCPICWSHKVVDLDEAEEANYQNEMYRKDPISFGRV